MKVWLTSGRVSGPDTDQTWFASSASVQGPVCLRTTKVGPRPNFPEPRVGSVFVGRLKTGPTPQTTFDCLGEKKSDSSMSATPVAGAPPSKSTGWPTKGTIVREMTFQSLLIEKGSTGWKLRM